MGQDWRQLPSQSSPAGLFGRNRFIVPNRGLSTPFAVSLSNHAFRRILERRCPKIPPRAWFDKLTANGVLDKLTTNGYWDGYFRASLCPRASGV
jgi:hypothetical protein